MFFGIYGNIDKDNIGQVLESLIEFLQRNSIDFAVENDLYDKIRNKKNKKFFISRKEILKIADILISLGGDGTFLTTARYIKKKNIPILGINLGRLGFMSEANPEEAKDFILDITKGKYKIYDLCVIEAKIPSGKSLFAMNEIVVDKSNSIRMIDIELSYNNEKVARFIADGIMISTPTGSTGYSLSAGGPIITPFSKVFIITPVCPHTLNFRPIIVPDNCKINIMVRSKEKIRITPDGSKSVIFNTPTHFEMKKADYTVKVIKRINKTYFHTLNKKLLWGADKRKYS